ncbi:MAG: hypothetical protein L0H79_14225 [Intrasporangium sp.]|nr:hypothetical protein [Intrasporangium sp.]
MPPSRFSSRLTTGTVPEKGGHGGLELLDGHDVEVVRRLVEDEGLEG